MTEFQWDAPKADANIKKHGVSFDEAASVFLDQLAVSGQDPDHSVGESRYITFGMSSLGRLLAVSHTHRLGNIRIISARRVTRIERKLYEEG
ncbi:MAG: BrnT family toxin [Burkholderiaceae bacterium]